MHPAFWIGGNINQRALCLYLLIVAAWRRAVSCALAAAIEKNLANDSESIDRSGNTLVAKGWTTQVQQSSGIDGARGLRGVQALFSDSKTVVRIATATRSIDCFADLGNHFGIQHLLGYYSYTTDLNESCTTRLYMDGFGMLTQTGYMAELEKKGPDYHSPIRAETWISDFGGGFIDSSSAMQCGLVKDVFTFFGGIGGYIYGMLFMQRQMQRCREIGEAIGGAIGWYLEFMLIFGGNAHNILPMAEVKRSPTIRYTKNGIYYIDNDGWDIIRLIEMELEFVYEDDVSIKARPKKYPTASFDSAEGGKTLQEWKEKHGSDCPTQASGTSTHNDAAAKTTAKSLERDRTIEGSVVKLKSATLTYYFTDFYWQKNSLSPATLSEPEYVSHWYARWEYKINDEGRVDGLKDKNANPDDIKGDYPSDQISKEDIGKLQNAYDKKQVMDKNQLNLNTRGVGDSDNADSTYTKWSQQT